MPTPASPAPAPGIRLFVARVAVRAIVIDFSMCDRWLMRMPPTAAPPNRTCSSRNKVMLSCRRTAPVCAPCADKHSAHGLAWFVGLAFVAGKVDGDRLILGDEV